MSTVATQNKFLMIILAILLPPAAVFAQRGLSGQFWLNIVLTLLGFWIVGIVHALAITL
ncbi:YqaE/Pmp3 family membrane protein [Stieleria mannarensis]|uniref:YqaE/Pmp3 family membrane protein n=1 Tax=Stieleria mannarensis TaxID=2755585 RepID=UPI0016043126|nr:YqaE/Pmp3 family membrane protein [Rhodopirellula sp. JC639]